MKLSFSSCLLREIRLGRMRGFRFPSLLLARGNLNAISSTLFGGVKRLVGRFNHLLDSRVRPRFRNPNTDSHRECAGSWVPGGFCFPARGCSTVGFTGNFAAIFPTAKTERAAFDVHAQELEMLENILRVTARKEDGELFTSHAIGVAATTHIGQTRCDHAQHLIAGVMAVSVIDALEMVDVHDSNGIGRFEAGGGIVEGAA